MASRGLFRKDKNGVSASHSEESRRKVKQQLGLRKCADPQDVTRAVDIVFVHGLTGNREKTWTNQTTSCFWPQDLLPSDLPNARIFTYDYDADVAHFFSEVSQSRIGDHAQTLLNSLVHTRERSETGTRPLFFVAHSLGGLVVEDMLLTAKNSVEPDLAQVLESTEGIVFMGTPHCGSQLAEWAKVFTSVAKLVKRVNQSIISVLQPDSEILARIQQEFHTMIRARNEAGKPHLKIMCFFEDHDTPNVGMVVPKHSAILPQYRSMSIPADHAGMTKFVDREDVGYERVSNELWMWTKEVMIKHAAMRPREEISVDSTSQRTYHPLLSGSQPMSTTTNHFQGSINGVGQVFQGGNFDTVNIGRF